MNNVTPIQFLKYEADNKLFIKRDDLLPFSFGGNKARKAVLFFKEIDNGDFDCVVTYGSSSSNHCRVVANMAVARGMPCYIISPEENYKPTFNSRMMDIFGAEITVCPVSCVHDTIEEKLAYLRHLGKKPYFIPGGGHGNIGTHAYVQCYDEIKEFENQTGIFFDYIFLASGTGTTHAGLVCGQIIHDDDRNIIGISIARKNPRGQNVVIDSVNDYLSANNYNLNVDSIEAKVTFLDEYIETGYGNGNQGIREDIIKILSEYGIPLDETYTGKAFHGMKQYIQANIRNSNILFIHTGGTPLFFDVLEDIYGGKI